MENPGVKIKLFRGAPGEEVWDYMKSEHKIKFYKRER